MAQEWDVSVAKNIEEVEKLYSAWQEMQAQEACPVPNADIDRYLSVLKDRQEDVKPYIILLRLDNCNKAMIIGRIEKHQLQNRIGYFKFLQPRVRSLTIVYGGVLGDTDEATCAVIMENFQKALRDKVADVVYFSNLRTDSRFYRFVRKAPGFFCRDRALKVNVHRSMSVPKDLEEFYRKRSKKHRGNMRRAVRKLEKEFPDRVKVVKYSQKNELEEAINAIREISSKTYQHAMCVGFRDDDQTLNILKTNSNKGWFCAYVLFLGDQPCAFQLMTVYKQAYFLDAIGYDPQYRRFDVGTVLFLKVLEDISGGPDGFCLDFGFGEADYKKSYGDHQWTEAAVYVFAPRFYPVCVNILKFFTAALGRGMESAARRAGILNKIKRFWRDRLRKKKAEASIGGH